MISIRAFQDIRIIKINFYAIILLSCLASCATTYQYIYPSKLDYKNKYVNADLEYYMIFDVFTKMGCNRFAKKEIKNKVSMVSVKLINKGATPISIDESHFGISSFGAPVAMGTHDVFYKQLRQRTELYVLYAFTGIYYTTLNSNTYPRPPEVKAHFIPVGLIIAPLNMAVSAMANSTLKKNIDKEKLLGKTIAPGDSACGFIYVNASAGKSLKFEVK